MDAERYDDPLELLTAASRERYDELVQCVVSGANLMVGAGSSCKAGYPDWESLLSLFETEARAINPERVRLATGTEYLLRSTVYREILGDEKWFSTLNEIFGPLSPPHHLEHESLIALPVRHVLTTNFDHVLESAHRSHFGDTPVSIDADAREKLASLRNQLSSPNQSRSYIHLHGSVERPEGISLTRQDYDALYHLSTCLSEFLKLVLGSGRIIFVGFGMRDPEFVQVLRFAASLENRVARHYALLPAPATEDEARIEAQNISGTYGVIPVHFDNSAEDYSALWRLIEKLGADAQAAGAPVRSFSESAIELILRETIPEQDNREEVITKTLRRLRTSTPSSSMTNVGAGERTEIDKEIDQVFDLVNDGRAAEAIACYEQIRVRLGDSLSDRLAYRIDANTGNAQLTLGDFIGASQSYLAATARYKSTKESRAIEVMGYYYKGDIQTAGDLVEALCQEEPDYARAWALWIRTRGEDSKYTQVLSSVPGAVHSDAEVAMALSEFARREGRIDEAVAHARQAVNAMPEWAAGRLTLASCIIESERRFANLTVDGEMAPRDPEPFQEVVVLTTEGIRRIGECDTEGHLAGLYYNRSVAQRVLGYKRESMSDVRMALQIRRKDDSAIPIGFAMVAETEGDVDAAIEALKSLAPDPEYVDQAAYALALMYMKRRGTGDLEAAEDQVNSLVDKIQNVEPQIFREAVLRLALSVRDLLGRSGESPGLVDELPENTLARQSLLQLKARALLLAGRRDEAAPVVRDVIDELDDTVLWTDRRDAAILAQDVGYDKDAVDLWQSFLPSDTTGPDSEHLVRAAYRCGEWRTVLDVCHSVRSAGELTWAHLQYEISVLMSTNEADRALKALRLWQETHPQDKRAALYLAVIAVQEARVDENPIDYDLLPKAAEIVNPQEGSWLVAVLRRGPNPASAIFAAYELYRRFPDEHQAHVTLIASVLDPTAPEHSVERPAQVDERSAVLVGREGDSPRWIYIENGPEPANSRNEYAHDHPLVTAMCGLSVGDRFTYREHSYLISGIENVALRRMHDVMEHYEENFPEHSALRRFRVPSGPSADLSLKENLGELYDVFSADDANRQLLESMYQEQRLPISSFARLYGRPIFEVVRTFACDRRNGIRADDGEPAIWTQAAAVVDGTQELVLDATSLGVALTLDSFTCLTMLGKSLLVPRSVLEQLRRLTLDASSSRQPNATVGIYNGEFFLHERTTEEMEQEVRVLEKAIAFIEDNCQIVGGESVVDLPPELRKSLGDAIDSTSLDAIALAMKRGCPLITDDLAFRRLISSTGLPVAFAWTHVLVRWAFDSSIIDREQLDRIHESMVRIGYSFARLSADDIAGIFRQICWDADTPVGSALIEMMGKEAYRNEHNLKVTAFSIKRIWERCPDWRFAKRITCKLLGSMSGSQAKYFARFIYRYSGSQAFVVWPAKPGTALQSIVHRRSISPFNDHSGKSLKRFLRSWRCNDGEFKPR